LPLTATALFSPLRIEESMPMGVLTFSEWEPLFDRLAQKVAVGTEGICPFRRGIRQIIVP
jgi:hypothetical protein